jgi:hypothetical protein
MSHDLEIVQHIYRYCHSTSFSSFFKPKSKNLLKFQGTISSNAHLLCPILTNSYNFLNYNHKISDVLKFDANVPKLSYQFQFGRLARLLLPLPPP